MREAGLRDARPDELAAVAALTREAYAEFGRVMAPGSWASLQRALDEALARADAAQVVVAERGGRIEGSVLLFPPAPDLYGALGSGPADVPELRLLAVAPAARGTGLGERLVRECARRARAAGAPFLGLHTSASMAAALRIYRRLGFRHAPEHDFHPAGGERVMALRLPLGTEP